MSRLDVVAFERGAHGSQTERNFHGFYQLLAGIRASKEAEKNAPLDNIIEGFGSLFKPKQQEPPVRSAAGSCSASSLHHDVACHKLHALPLILLNAAFMPGSARPGPDSG